MITNRIRLLREYFRRLSSIYLLAPPPCCIFSISLWYRNLKPLQSARMSGYWLFNSSYACGITRTIHAFTREPRDALKQR